MPRPPTSSPPTRPARSKANRSLIAFALFVLDGTGAAGASQRDDAIEFSALAPVAALAGDRQPASDIVPPDLGAAKIGDGEQPIAKTGLWSSIKDAAKKVGGAVKSAAAKSTRAVGKVVSKIAKNKLLSRILSGRIF